MIHLQALADQIQTRWKLGAWTIEVKEMPQEKRSYKGSPVYGMVDHSGNEETATIYINPEYSAAVQRHTLYHEMMHLRLEGHGANSYYERGIDLIAGELANRG